MRSLSSRVFASCLVAVLLTSVVFVASHVLLHRFVVGPLHQYLSRVLLRQGVEIYESGGPVKLKDYLAEVSTAVEGDVHLTDVNGRDVVSGQDFSYLLRNSTTVMGLPKTMNGRVVFTRISSDGRYGLIATVSSFPRGFWEIAGSYFIVLFGIVLASVLFTRGIVSPIKELTHAVDVFGRGDLSARADCCRKDEIGELSRAFGTMADRIQNLLAAQQRLLQDISHELRSPLARLSFSAELVKTTMDRDAASKQIAKDVMRLSSLVNGLLDVIRSDDDAITQSMESIALGEVCQDLLSDCELEARACGCLIRRTVWRDGHIIGNAELLRRAVENVLRNAIRHAPRNTVVDFGLDVSGSEAKIVIRDHGPGVPAEALGHIFEPFFRVDGSRQGSTGGIGLGLSIARRSVHLHRGTLTAENAAPGLRVDISLPLFLRTVGTKPAMREELAS
jgi:signal transduction histidine kinase